MRYVAACADPMLRTLEAIAKAAHVNRTTAWRWHQQPDFTAWVQDQLQKTFGLKYTIALHRALDLAIQGSPEHMKLLMLKFGDLKASAEYDGRSNHQQHIAVMINVPRPDQLQAHTLAQPDSVSIAPMPQPISDHEH